MQLHADRFPRPSGAYRGFTFVEMLAAMLFVAILLPAVIHGLTLSSRVGVGAERKAQAMLLADRVLTEAVVTGAWRTQTIMGDGGELWPGYEYEVTDETWDVTSGLTLDVRMRRVTARVSYTVREQVFYIETSTLAEEIDPADAAAQAGTE